MTTTSLSSDIERLYGWAFQLGCKIMKLSDGDKLLKRLLYDIRGESLPGRFREKLMNNLMYIFDAKGMGFEKIPKNLLVLGTSGNEFYYVKSAILMGFMDALAGCGSGGE